MKPLSRAAVCAALLLMSSAALAQNKAACAAAQFSDELLQSFPRAPDACLDVITRGGEDYAVFNARLTRVRGNTARLRFRNPDGSMGPTTSIDTPSDFRVLVDGEPTRVRDLAENQDIKAYVQVNRAMVALEPADATQRLHVVPFVVLPVSAQAGEDTGSTRVAAASGEPRMPDTAGPLPLIASFGVLFACAAFGMRTLRGFNARRRERVLARVPTPHATSP